MDIGCPCDARAAALPPELRQAVRVSGLVRVIGDDVAERTARVTAIRADGREAELELLGAAFGH